MDPSVTLLLVAFTCGTSLLAFQDEGVFSGFSFNPYLIKHKREFHRFLTSALIHANYIHLVLNMYVLYMFGPFVEEMLGYLEGNTAIGRLLFALLYVSAAPISAIYSFEKHKHNPHYNAVGASGAISAVVFAFIVLRPGSSMGLVFLPFLRLPAVLFGVLYLWYSWVMARRGGDKIGHDVHFFGALYGMAFMFIYKPGLFKSLLEKMAEFSPLSLSF
ncbi:MAG: rhomboid family intramembrane serine protease [Flavobacteriales bacterium]|nr:rhomboid family intramembrane serine protease [Flavobacteriales bacterium]MCX7769271.1 rhomboid family intramembrane serine protease [Flavobacteriales bacterium]MDW8409986.1 rhomboid family intramembrane serine protease [Flavobacteriales bacterium]